MQRWWPLLLLMLVLPLRFPGALPGPRVVSADDHLTVHHAFQDADAGGTVHHPHLSDPALQFKALQRRTVASLRRGEAPLWNPDLYAGAPLLADGQSSPPRLSPLRALLPEDLAQDLGELGPKDGPARRRPGRRPLGAAVGGVVAMLGPYPRSGCFTPRRDLLPCPRRRAPERLAAAVAVAAAGGGHWARSPRGSLPCAVAAPPAQPRPPRAWWRLLLASPVLALLAEQAGRSSTLVPATPCP